MVLGGTSEYGNRADLIEMFKMVKGLTAVSWSFFFHRAEDRTTRGHSWKLCSSLKNHCRCNTRLVLFSASCQPLEKFI